MRYQRLEYGFENFDLLFSVQTMKCTDPSKPKVQLRSSFQHSAPVYYHSSCTARTAPLRTSDLLSLHICLLLSGSPHRVHDRIRQVLVLLLFEYFLLGIYRNHEVKRGRGVLHSKRGRPLQHIQHFYQDYQSIRKSISHRVSAMEQLSSFPSRVRSSDISSTFLFIQCS